MPKSRPSKVIVHRIELQQFERDLLEQIVIGNGAIRLVDSLVPLVTTLADPVRLYGLLTLLESLGVLDTPVPTLVDASDDLEAASTAIKDFLGLSVEYQAREDANRNVQKTAAVQAEEANEKAQAELSNTAQAHQEGQVSWEEVQAAQERANQAQAEAWRQRKIAGSWEYWFYFQKWDESKARGDNPPKGRWPTRKEVNQAKKEGTYYGGEEDDSGGIVNFLFGALGRTGGMNPFG